MDTLQTWIVVGVPGLVGAACLFVGRSRLRALLGYAVLAAIVLTFVLVPGDEISAAIVGVIMVSLVAAGRGQTDDEFIEHHEDRERFTVADRAA
jgi:hypothetical protein